MSKTKYTGVFKDDNNGRFRYSVVDKVTGKRITKKARRDNNNKPFTSAYEAYKELTRVKNDYLETNGYANYRLTYGKFMEKKFIPNYKTTVEDSTWQTRKHMYDILMEHFDQTKLQDISISDCEDFRISIANNKRYSKDYGSQIYGSFRRTLDYAVLLGLLDENVSKKTKALPKGEAIVPFWTKEQFEKVLSVICTENAYENMCFVMIWVYYMTGIRVSEGLALNWTDIDLNRKKMNVFHTLDRLKKGEYKRKPYTKTESGKRTISLDDDTIKILKSWKKRQEDMGVRDYVLSYTGDPLYRSTVKRNIEKYSKLAGVPPIQGKGLLHSHVSYLINEFNTGVLTISRRLGHSSPEITLKYYSHLWSRNDEGIAEQMTGNIHYKVAKKSGINFNGNQVIKFSKKEDKRSFHQKNRTQPKLHSCVFESAVEVAMKAFC